MASIRTREWTTRTGKKRRGFEVSWYEGKQRRKKLFSGPDARLNAKRWRGKLDSAEPAVRLALDTSDGSDQQGPLTIREAGERWVRYVEREKDRERSTWAKYEQHLEDHLLPATIVCGGAEVVVGNLLAAEISAPNCEALKDKLLKTLSPKLAAKALGTFRMMLNDVVRRGERLSNPAQTVRIRQTDRGEGEVQIPSLDEMRAIIKAATTEAPAPMSFDEAWVGLTIFTGLRPSENRGLAIEDAQLDGNTPGITVQRRADQWNVIGPVKSASGRRFISLGPASLALLKRWLLAVPKGDGFDDPIRGGRKLHPLFPTSVGTVQSLANIHHRVWVPLLTKAGLVDWVPVLDDAKRSTFDAAGKEIKRPVPIYTLNCLRHFAASLMINEGMGPKKVQKRMGHSSIQVTFDLYGHLFDKRETDAAEVERIEQTLLG